MILSEKKHQRQHGLRRLAVSGVRAMERLQTELDACNNAHTHYTPNRQEKQEPQEEQQKEGRKMEKRSTLSTETKERLEAANEKLMSAMERAGALKGGDLRTVLHKLYLNNESIEREAERVRLLAAMFSNSFLESFPIEAYSPAVEQDPACKAMRDHFDNAASVFFVLEERISLLEKIIKDLSGKISAEMNGTK